MCRRRLSSSIISAPSQAPARFPSCSTTTRPRTGSTSTCGRKESSPDSRRFTDIINAFGERYVLFAGLDDVAFEALALGARGWVSGLSNAFPAESLELFAAVMSGNLARARAIYRWFMPLLHLDSDPDLVQAIKLAEELMGRGSERVRLPRLPLAGERRAEVIGRVRRAVDTRPRP
jgi:4-hydroxy-tetrahydrodipicolinate synthase